MRNVLAKTLTELRSLEEHKEFYDASRDGYFRGCYGLVTLFRGELLHHGLMQGRIIFQETDKELQQCFDEVVEPYLIPRMPPEDIRWGYNWDLLPDPEIA